MVSVSIDWLHLEPPKYAEIGNKVLWQVDSVNVGVETYKSIA